MNQVYRLDEDLSLRFYNFLCKIIGTENVVRARREYLATTDYFYSSKNVTRITSGSKGEGLYMKASDMDVMLLITQINVLENIPDDNNVTSNTFVIKSDDSKPGFTQLKLCSSMGKRDITTFCEPQGPDFFLSNERAKIWFQSILQKGYADMNTIHGPCISDGNEKYDLALSLRCSTWIQQAHHWATRNKVWPSAEVASKIINYGVLFVPIGCKNSPTENLEWRISFSVAEKHLIFSFSHTQLLCYALLKILLKDVIETDTRLKGLLCSYFLKTVVFWVSEELPLTAWQPGNIIPCFMNCFRRLVYCVKYSILPHYFITENNLFENRFSLTEGTYLINLLNDLYPKGYLCLMYSETLSDFFQSHNVYCNSSSRSKFESLFDQFDAIRQLKDGAIFFKDLTFFPYKLINFVNRYRKTKYLFMYHMIFKGYVTLTSSPGYSNKIHYQTHKQWLPDLILGLSADAVSGWLYLATYFYCCNRFKLSLELIDYALSKCTSDKIYYDNTTITTDMLHVIEKAAIDCLKGNMNVIYRRHMIRVMSFMCRSSLCPDEMKNEVEIKRCVLKPPVIYAHFLRFLCFYKLSDVNNCRDSLWALELTIKNDYFIGNDKARSDSFSCLGMAYYISGDLDTASACFINSVQLCKDRQERYANWMLEKIKK